MSDVQWGLLAGKQTEHGGRHRLHVNLGTGREREKEEDRKRGGYTPIA